MPADARARRPAPDRWSVAEVLEHLGLVEGRVVGLLGQLLQAAPMADESTRASVTPLDRTTLRDRSRRVDAPAPIQPTGTVGADEAWTTLERTRAQLLALLDTAEADTRDLAQISRQHPALGTLDGYQWVASVGGHEERHTLQIVEIGEALSSAAE